MSVPVWVADEAFERADAGVPVEEVELFVREWAELQAMAEQVIDEVAADG